MQLPAQHKDPMTARDAEINVSYHRSPLPSVDGDTTYYDDAIYNDQNALDILKLILYDLNSAIAPRDLRLMAIQAALDEFDHDDEPLHDEELELRADHILLQKLTYALSIDPTGIEVGHICSALECVYRGGRARLAQSFHEICDVLLPLFVDMIRPPAGYNPANISLQRKSMNENPGEGGGVDTDMKLDMIQENYSEEKLHYGDDDDDDESVESVVIPLHSRTDGLVVNSVSIPPGTGDYLAELKRRISGEDGGEGIAISTHELLELKNNPATTVAVANEYQRDWPNELSSIVPALSINASDQQHALVLHQMNNQPSIATEVGTDVTDLNALILMELEDAKTTMSNVTEWGHGNYLTSAPLTTDQSEEEDDGAMALRGGGDEEEGDNEEDDDDDVLPITFDHSQFKDDYEDSQDNPFSDSSSFSTSFRSHGDGSRSSYGATSHRINKGIGEEQEGNASDASFYVSEDNSHLVAYEQYKSERDNASTQNPFVLESSPYRNIEYDGGGSSVYSKSIHGGGYGSEHANVERDEDSISRFPKMDNFIERGRNGNDSQYEESVTDSQVAPGFDEYGRNAPPSIYGYDDETYVDADGRSEYHDANSYKFRGQYAEDTKHDIYSTSDVREQYYSDAYEEEKQQDGKYSVEDDAHLCDADEDIFHFQEPKMFTTDYFNYSDPVESKVCPLAVRKVLKTLRYFSRVLSAMEPMAQQQGLVDACLYHMTKIPLTVDYDDEIASRVDAIAIMVNLACAEENKIMLVYHPGLLDAVINISNHDPIDEAREHAAIVLMNLVREQHRKYWTSMIYYFC